MPSVVDIANRALDKLGHGAITSLSDGTKAANLVDRTWPIVRDQVLRSHPWNFAIVRDTLAPLSDAPSWGFSYQHQLPNDLLRLIEVLDLSTDDYQIENNRILCDSDLIYIRYLQQVTDPNQYDAMFVNAVSTAMALEMCESLTQSNTKKQLLADEYEMVMQQTKFVDAVENPPTKFEEDSWIEVRY